MMLCEEVSELEQPMVTGTFPDVLAESVEILYLTFNLTQECGLERVLGAAVLMKHSDNVCKQHDSILQLSLTKAAYARQKRRWNTLCLEHQELNGCSTPRASW